MKPSDTLSYSFELVCADCGSPPMFLELAYKAVERVKQDRYTFYCSDCIVATVFNRFDLKDILSQLSLFSDL